MEYHGKTIVLGMNPGYGSYMKVPSTYKKLYSWMAKLGIQYFSFANVNDQLDHVPLKLVDYDRLNTLTRGYDNALSLGNYASDALKKINVKHFKLPHPSGRNRLLNDKTYEETILEECRKYIR